MHHRPPYLVWTSLLTSLNKRQPAVKAFTCTNCSILRRINSSSQFSSPRLKMQSLSTTLSQEQRAKIESLFELHPPTTEVGQIISYGTAGFRDKAKYLSSVVMHTGILASLRSRHQASKAIGIIITASHNPNDDNGVKIIDFNGEMLTMDWEDFATKLANCRHSRETIALVDDFATKMSIDLSNSIKCKVLIARDTRTSGSVLATAGKNGASILCSQDDLIDFTILTTPQLHFIVKCTNDPSYGVATELGYYSKFGSAFKSLVGMKSGPNKNYQNLLTVDCANGVASVKLEQLLDYISCESLKLNIKLENTDINTPEKLNNKCGADFVKLTSSPPQGLLHQVNVKYVTFDGDADRIIYYYLDSESNFNLVDGDKIAILFCHFVCKLLDETGLKDKLSFALVQTAYANGASTIYAREELKLTTHCVPTGVKHLHHQAKQCDIAVYFEANGHGTILFSDKADALIRGSVDDESRGPEVRRAAAKFAQLIDLTNQTSGDAMSDFLIIEAILHHLDWSIERWNSLYTDLPSKQLKVPVNDRSKVTTSHAETRVVTPIGLQDEIDAAVRLLGPNSRCFVRPSGTENIVRVYAEAATGDKASSLANSVAASVQVFVNGLTDEDK